jgi:hypothetical protein
VGHAEEEARGGGASKGRGRGGSSSSGPSSKPTDNECQHYGKMEHRACECRLKPKKE